MRLEAPSVRVRVTVGATVVLVLAVAVASLATAGLLGRGVQSERERLLVHEVDAVADRAAKGRLTPTLATTLRDIGQIQVFDAHGREVARTPGFGSTPLDAIHPPALGHQRAATVDGRRVDGIPGDRYRIVARTVQSPTGPQTIYAVASVASAHQAELLLRNGVLLLIPVIAALTAWFVWWVVGRALSPVDDMRRRVDRIEAHDLSQRIPPGRSDDEIAKLATTVNRMLDRLEEGTARQELFAASASHELRSPLSAIRTDLEVGLAYPAQADWKRIAGDTLIEIDRLDQLSRDLRSLIQMRATSTAAERFDLAELVAAETGRSRDGKAVHFEHGPGSTCIRADRESVLRLVRNLLDNARRHATSSVVASVRGDATWVTFEIANDGDPIPDTEREHIFEPFTRLDAARELDSEGSGLGLAIARAAAEANDGTLVALPTDDGATFEARFPPA